MARSIPCKTCGFLIGFEEADQGSHIYCNSCGCSNYVPFVAEVTDEFAGPSPLKTTTSAEKSAPVSPSLSPVPPRGRPLVFSITGAAEVAQRVIGEETCLCGAVVPVRAEDYGDALYCPSCGTEIQVGDTLVGGKYRMAHPAEENGPDAVAALPTDRTPAHPLVFRRSIILVVVLGLSFILSYLNWRRSETMIGTAGVEEIDSSAPDRQPVKAEEDHPITLDMIHQLGKSADDARALIQAHLWQMRLRESGVSESDPRLMGLRETIDMLTARLAPVSEPPAYVGKFDGFLKTCAEKLTAGDLDSARQAHSQAKLLLQQYLRELKPYTQRLENLSERLIRAERTEQIRRLLHQASQDASEDRLAKALESEARARFFALRRVDRLTESDFRQLDAQSRELAEQLRFARGRRAVVDAQRCAQVGDIPSRNRAVHSALVWLPGQPEDRIKPFLDQIRPWISEVESSRDSPPTSAIGLDIQRRNRYETALEKLAEGQVSEALTACIELESSFDAADEPSRRMHQGIGTLWCDVWELEIAAPRKPTKPSAARDQLVAKLSALCQSCDRMGPWEDPRWKTFKTALPRQGTKGKL